MPDQTEPSVALKSAALKQIHRQTLAAAGQSPRMNGDQRFQRLGLRVPAVRALVKTGYPFLADQSRANTLSIWHHIFMNTPIYEVAHQAIYAYQYTTLKQYEFNTVRQWLNRCDCWEHSDDLSKIYAQVFEENPDWVMPWYRKWNANKNPWKRRQSVVGLIEYAQKRQAVQPFVVLISFIKPLLGDDAYYVQKGVGWTLREIYNLYPEQTLNFFEDYLTDIQPAAWSAAVEKLSPARRQSFNQARARHRRAPSIGSPEPEAIVR